MDKKSIIGLVLIGLILFGYTWYSGQQAKKMQAERMRRDSVTLAEVNSRVSRVDSLSPVVDTVAQGVATDSQNSLRNNIGDALYDASQSENQTFTIANSLATFDFSTLGGTISEVTLRDYTTYGGKPLQMFVPGSERFDVRFFIKRGYNNFALNTGDYNFECQMPDTTWLEGEQSKVVRMRLRVDSTAYLDYLYTIYPDNYMVDFDIDFNGMKGIMANQYNFEIDWKNTSPQNEKGFDNENTYTTVAYMYPNDKKPEQLSMGKAGSERTEKITNKISWVGFKQQFFSSILVARQNFQDGEVGYKTYKPGSGVIKDFSAQLAVPYEPEQNLYKFNFYFGPNKFNVLDKYELGFERLVPLGGSIVGWINRWFVIPMFDWLSKYIGSFGWIILIMTVVIKLIISPVTYKSYLSSAKMRVLKPEVDALAEKFPRQEDAMKKQQATMELYSKAGVSPMSGCIPMLIQLPILWAMFRFFPASIELRGQKLFWADDLSSYDSILNLPFNIPWYGDHISLFALLMTVTLVVTSLLNFKSSAQPQMAGMKFMMVYLMPVMMLFWMNNYASGLCYYYFLSSLITLAQMYAIRAMIDDKKLHAKMMERAKQPKKKSRFRQRYENALKSQQQQLREAQKNRR